MDEAKSYLFAGERVVLTVRPHHVTLVRPSLLPLAGLALVAVLPNRYTAAILLVGLLRVVWEIAQWRANRFILTSDRILSMEGIVTKKVISMPLAKITDLTYARSLGGRLLGYGALDLESAGQQGLERIDFLPDPDNFYRTVMSLALSPRYSAPPPPSDSSPVDQRDEHTDDKAERTSRGTGSFGGNEPEINLRTAGDRIHDTGEIPIIRTSDD